MIEVPSRHSSGRTSECTQVEAVWVQTNRRPATGTGPTPISWTATGLGCSLRSGSTSF
jgi:hypothetical protein